MRLKQQKMRVATKRYLSPQAVYLPRAVLGLNSCINNYMHLYSQNKVERCYLDVTKSIGKLLYPIRFFSLTSR